MPLSPADLATLKRLHDSLDHTYSQVLDGEREVILLDQPDHRNLGDTLIFAGQLDTLERIGAHIRYCATTKSVRFSEIEKLPASWPILCTGGGNFGDLYTLHNNFRAELVRAFPSRKIVFLPQTAFFNTNEGIDHIRKSLAPAQNLTLMMRSQRSYSFAAEAFAQHATIYCMDSALGINAHEPLGYIRYSPSAPAKIHLLARHDSEAPSDSSEIRLRPMDTEGDYWPFPRKFVAQWAVNRLATDLPLKYLPDGKIRDVFRKLRSSLFASTNLNAFPHTLRGASIVATNRLHTHIYCSLAGIPHVVSDNSHGKISEIYREFTHAFTTAHWANTLPQAYEKAVELSESSGRYWKSQRG